MIETVLAAVNYKSQRIRTRSKTRVISGTRMIAFAKIFSITEISCHEYVLRRCALIDEY